MLISLKMFHEICDELYSKGVFKDRTRRVFIYPENLLLEDVVRFASGAIKSGWVINGHWIFEVRGDEHLAKNGNHIVNRWAAHHLIEVEISDDAPGDYNELIQRIKRFNKELR